MMTSEQRSAVKAARPRIDFTDVDPRETSRAWNKFLSNRNAPSLPMTGVRSLIYQSWVRSTTTGIKPDQFAAPSLERSSMATKSSHDQAELRRAARASMLRIGDLLSGAEAMLLLTDRDGLILETVGDSSTLSKAGKINLSVGGLWSEHASGTNGIGTALWTGQPVYVHGEEHFCEGMKAWSCAAAPIRDPIDQSIIGVVNLSGLTRIFQKHNAAFAATAARDIELVLQQEQSLMNIRLMEATMGSPPGRAMDNADGLAIIDRFGRLIFSRNSGVNTGRADQDLGLGAHFLELPDGISEAKIAAALPKTHCCDDIRLIEIDGIIKGAALAFRQRPNAAHAAPAIRPLAPALPGVLIGTTGLKIVGKSEAILEALDTAQCIASANQPTLIEGQTGVGKELFARLIHARMSPESGDCFRTVNCGAMNPKMFGDALLQPLESGETAPLCLDEIGETSAETQLYLLRILEEQSARLHGPHPPAQALRVLSLTNRAMRDEVEAGRFRRDLFYRLSTLVLTIPPLHARGEDILLIAEHYIRKICIETGRDRLIFSPEVQDALMAHVWPGNVRELRNVVLGLHSLAKSRTLTLADLPGEITTPALAKAGLTEVFGAQQPNLARDASIKQAEVRLIEDALKRHHGNLSKAALALGISRPTLYRKIEAYGIRTP